MNTSNIKVLTSDETKELFEKMKNGFPLARNILIKDNLKLILSILKEFVNGNMELDKNVN